jgi:hypothetical protein
VNEERTGKCLRQVEHICGHLWHILHNGQPSHGDDRKIFEVMTSALPKGMLGAVASLLAATLYQGNPDRNHKLWNIVSSERYIITGFVSRLTRRVPLVDQELLTLPEHLSSSPVFSGVLVTRSLLLYVCYVDRCLPFCTFSFGHGVICSFSIYRFWLPLWYLQTLLARK